MAYQDSAHIWTIGYGHTGPEVKQGYAITMAQARAYFISDAAPLMALVAGRNIFEAAALVSFGYNCGAGSLRKYLAGDIVVTPAGDIGVFQVKTSSGAFVNFGYVDGAGHILTDLQMRRTLEAGLILAARNN